MDSKRKAALAEALFNNPLLEQLLLEMEAGAVSRWGVEKSAAAREELWHYHKAITDLRGRIRAELQSMIRGEG